MLPPHPSLPSALHSTFLTVSFYSVGYFWVLFHITYCTVLACYSISFLRGAERWSRYWTSAVSWFGKSWCRTLCVRKDRIFSFPVWARKIKLKFQLDCAGSKSLSLAFFLNNLREFKRISRFCLECPKIFVRHSERGG